MRTTLTLAPDVEKQIKLLERSQETSFKDLINGLIRAGLAVYAAEERQAKAGVKKRKSPSFTKPVTLGTAKIVNLDDVSEVLALSEGEAFK